MNSKILAVLTAIVVGSLSARAYSDNGCCELPGGGDCAGGPSTPEECEATFGPGTTWHPNDLCGPGMTCIPKAADVPSVSEWGFFVLAMLMIAVGAAIFRWIPGSGEGCPPGGGGAGSSQALLDSTSILSRNKTHL